MLSKERVLQELDRLLETTTGFDREAIERAIRSVQDSIADTGVIGALWNATVIPSVLPKLTAPVRQNVLRIISLISKTSNDDETETT